MRHVSFCVLLSFALTALGQSSGTLPKPPATGSSGSSSSITGSTSTLPSAVNPSNNDSFARSSGGIQGRLIPSPSTRVMIELYQEGARIDTAFSQSDGLFSFPRARIGFRYEVRIGVTPDTEFRQELDFQPGYPAVIQINNPLYLHNINPGKKASGGVISMANLMAPKKAVQEFEKGRDLGQKKKYDEGMEHLQKAVGLYAKYPDAYNEMGLIEKRQEHLPQAEEMFRKAIDADPKWTSPYMNLAQIQLGKKDYAEMLKTTETVLQLDSNIGAAHFFQAVGLLNTNKLEAAEKEALLAEKDETNKIPQVQLLLGNIYEMRGNSSDAVTRYRLFLKQLPETPNNDKLMAHINDLEHPGKLAKAAANP